MKSLLVRGRKTISFYDSSIAGGGYIIAVDPLFNPSPSTPGAVQPSQPPAPVQGDLSVSISGTTWHFVSVLFTSNTFPIGTVVTGIRYVDGVQTSFTAYVGTALTISGASDTVGYRYIGAVSSTASITAPGTPTDTGYFNATYTKNSLLSPASAWSVSTTVNGFAVTTAVTGPASTYFYGFGTTNGVANQPFLQTTSSAGQFFITEFSAVGSYFYSVSLTDDGTYASGTVVGNTVTAVAVALTSQVAFTVSSSWQTASQQFSTVVSNPNANSITTSFYTTFSGGTSNGSSGNIALTVAGGATVTVPTTTSNPAGTSFYLTVNGVPAGSTYAALPSSTGNTVVIPAVVSAGIVAGGNNNFATISGGYTIYGGGNNLPSGSGLAWITGWTYSNPGTFMQVVSPGSSTFWWSSANPIPSSLGVSSTAIMVTGGESFSTTLSGLTIGNAYRVYWVNKLWDNGAVSTTTLVASLPGYSGFAGTSSVSSTTWTQFTSSAFSANATSMIINFTVSGSSYIQATLFAVY